MDKIEAISGVGGGQAQTDIFKIPAKNRFNALWDNLREGGYVVNNGYNPKNNRNGSIMVNMQAASNRRVTASGIDANP